MRSTVASHRKLTTTYWEDHRSWSTCRRTNINTSKVTHHVKQIGKVKKIHKGEPHVVVVQSAQSCPTLCDPMDCSTPGIPVPHHLPQFAQTHVCWTDDAIQPSHPLPSPSPLTLNLSQNQGLSQWVHSLHLVAKVLELQFPHQSFQWLYRVDFLSKWLVWSLVVHGILKSLLPAPQFGSISSLALSLLYGPTFAPIQDYWKNHTFDYMDLCWQSDVSAF